MELLKDKIKKEGRVTEDNILMVDSFLNHQMDVEFFNEVGKEFKEDTESKVVSYKEIPDGWEGFDIGTETIKMYTDELKNAATVLWNGPVGLFEFDQFAVGTNAIANTLAEIDAVTVIGGGDSAAAIKKAGLSDKMTHISTGGGASLEFIEGKKLPGIECLMDKLFNIRRNKICVKK